MPAVRHCGLLRALLLVATAAPAAVAQSVSGTILGTVTDSSGAVVAGAKVTILNEGTALTRTVTSDANGEYTAPSLPTGTLHRHERDDRLQDARAVEHRARRRPARPHRPQARSRRDDRVGQRRRPRRRWSRPPRPSSGTTVGNEQIEALPLNGRNFVNLTRTVPASCAAFPARTSTAPAAWPGAPRRRSRPTASGRATTTTCSTASTTTRPGCRPSCIFPSVDALDEFKLQTITYSAEFGRSLGGVVNLQIKSGTNQLHGSAFEFHRNDAFDANNFFNNRAGRAKPDFKQNQFGGTLGGAGLQGQDVLLRRLPGPPRDAGADVPVDGAVAGDAQRRFLRAEPGHLRSDDRPAVPRQRRFPSDRIDPVATQHPEPALSRAEHRRHAPAPTGRRSTTT